MCTLHASTSTHICTRRLLNKINALCLWQKWLSFMSFLMCASSFNCIRNFRFLLFVFISFLRSLLLSSVEKTLTHIHWRPITKTIKTNRKNLSSVIKIIRFTILILVNWLSLIKHTLERNKEWMKWMKKEEEKQVFFHLECNLIMSIERASERETETKTREQFERPKKYGHYDVCEYVRFFFSNSNEFFFRSLSLSITYTHICHMQQ